MTETIIPVSTQLLLRKTHKQKKIYIDIIKY